MLPRRLIRLLDDLLRPDRGGAGGAYSAGYDIVVLEEGAEISFASVDASVGVTTSANVSFTVGPDGTRYIVAVRARTAAGIAGEPAVRLLRLVADSGDLVARPNPPTGLIARPLADGDVELRWRHSDNDATVAVYQFKVFGDGGSGQVDYGTPLDTVGLYDTRVALSGLTVNVRHKLAVRAYSAAGYHDGNLAVAGVVPRDDPPPGLTELEVSQVA